MSKMAAGRTGVVSQHAGRAKTVILLAVALSTSLPFFIVLPQPVLRVATALLALLLLLAFRLHSPMAIHVSLMTFLLAAWMNVQLAIPGLINWPFHFGVPLIVYAAAVAAASPLRQTASWLHLGKFDRRVWESVGLTVLISASALLLWFVLWQPDLSNKLSLIPDWNPILRIAGGLGFALVNAAMEESIYRGVLMEGLDAALGSGALPVILQAVAFGTIHLQGIPSGPIGILMATIYGLMLGWVKRRSGGMLAPFVAHVFADVVIFAILVFWVT